MVSLSSAGSRFETLVEVIEGGRGFVSGVLTEAPQDQVPSYTFVNPRLLFRVQMPTALRSGVVIRTPAGEVFMVGDNGPSETSDGTIWTSFRLFKATHRLVWKRRTKVLDPIAQIEREGQEVVLGTIWAAIEPTDREAFDRRIRTSMEQARVLTAADIENDDLLDEWKVIRADPQLGLRIGMVS